MKETSDEHLEVAYDKLRALVLTGSELVVCQVQDCMLNTRCRYNASD
jgi:hypothetical protein